MANLDKQTKDEVHWSYPVPCVNVSEQYIYQWVRKLNEEVGEAVDAIYNSHRPH